MVLYHFPPFFPGLFFSFLISQSLLAFFVVFFVTPPPINILSSHSLPRTDPSHFTIFTKFYSTSNSFSVLHFSACCLLSLFFFPLDILPPCEVTFAVSHRLSSFIRPIVLVLPLRRSCVSQWFFFPSLPSAPPIHPDQNVPFTLSRVVFLKLVFPSQYSSIFSLSRPGGPPGGVRVFTRPLGKIAPSSGWHSRPLESCTSFHLPPILHIVNSTSPFFSS